MKRRQVLKGVVASSVLGVGGASGTPGTRRVDVEQFDFLRVVADGETVARVPNPTWETVRQVETRLAGGQTLVTPEDDCVAVCEANCPCRPCLVGCFNCCNVEESICGCCSEVDDPENTECCEGC